MTGLLCLKNIKKAQTHTYSVQEWQDMRDMYQAQMVVNQRNQTEISSLAVRACLSGKAVYIVIA